ncbi:MAG: hypothetical protein HOQ25_05780, partial [Mesorhizobium sp.]|nr:hypothetical protein [Mesorhizobium sp.]
MLPLMLAAPTAAAIQEYNDHPACDGQTVDPARRIAACTQIIEDRSETKHNRSIAYVIRGNAFN